MKKLSHLALAIGFAGICLTACTSYSAWKRVGEEYRSINEKGKKVLENMTEDQRKELEKFSEKMSDKAAEFNHEELKKQFDDIMEQANDFVDDIKQQLQGLKEENE